MTDDGAKVWEQRLLQALPTLFSLTLTAFIPYAARRSLKLWRATQVYDAQPINANTDFTYTQPARKSILTTCVQTALLFSPIVTELLLFFTAGYDWDATWPAFAALRRITPYLAIFLIVFVGFLVASTQILPDFIHLAQRSMDSKTFSAQGEFVHMTTSHPMTNRRAITYLCMLVVVPSMIVTYICYTTSHAALVLSLVALGTVPTTLAAMVRATITLRSKTSVRAHMHVFVIGMMIAAVVLFLCALLVCALVYFFDNDKNSSSSSGSSKTGLAGIDTDVPSLQVLAIVYAFIWWTSITLPASLVTLLYRLDASAAGLTHVTQEQINDTLAISREVAEQNQRHSSSIISEKATQSQSQSQSHPYDVLGRIPILIDCHALQHPQQLVAKHRKPMFYASWFALIAIQLVGLGLNFLLPAHVLSPMFPHSKADLKSIGGNVTPYIFSMYPFLAYPIILLVVIPVVGASTRYGGEEVQGEEVMTGWRKMWTYEEQRGVDYKQKGFASPVSADDDRATDVGKEQSLENKKVDGRTTEGLIDVET